MCRESEDIFDVPLIPKLTNKNRKRNTNVKQKSEQQNQTGMKQFQAKPQFYNHLTGLLRVS